MRLVIFLFSFFNWALVISKAFVSCVCKQIVMALSHLVMHVFFANAKSHCTVGGTVGGAKRYDKDCIPSSKVLSVSKLTYYTWSRHRIMPSVALYPALPVDVPIRHPLDPLVCYLLHTSSCILYFEAFDSVGWFALGCGHIAHLYYLTCHMVARASYPYYFHDITVSTYRGLGMDDLYLVAIKPLILLPTPLA